MPSEHHCLGKLQLKKAAGGLARVKKKQISKGPGVPDAPENAVADLMVQVTVMMTGKE